MPKTEKTKLEQLQEWYIKRREEIENNTLLPDHARLQFLCELDNEIDLINSAFAEGLSEGEIKKQFPGEKIFDDLKRQGAKWANNQLTKRKI